MSPIDARLRATLISGSPSARSRSRGLLDALAAALEPEGVDCTLVDLSKLSADGLLGRVRSSDVDAALDAVRGAAIIAAGTPVYRATYSGLLKVFFDLLEPGALRGRAAIAVASGGSSAHQLAIEHGLAPLFASVGATVVPTGIYLTDALYPDDTEPSNVPPDQLPPAVAARIRRAASEAVRLATAFTDEPSTVSSSGSP